MDDYLFESDPHNMKKNEISKTALFEEIPIMRAVGILCVPTIISSLVMMLYSLVDTYFVGMLGDPVQASAVSLAGPVILAFNAVNNLFGVGTSSMMSRSLGLKDYETVKWSSAFGFYGALIASVFFSLLCISLKSPLLTILGADNMTWKATAEYLFWTASLGATPAILNVVLSYMVRSEGSTLHASIGTMSGCILNMVLDPIFILPWGLNMGAAGAGCATFISNVVACLYFFVFLFIKRGKTFVSIHPRDFRPSRRIAKEICGVGIPASIQNLLNVTGMTILNNFAAGFGADAVAAIGISHKISMVPWYIVMGVSNGIMPLVSYNYASRNIHRMKQGIKVTASIELSVITLISIIMCVFSAPIVRMFMDSDGVVAIGKIILIGMSASVPFLVIDFLGVGIFNACGMGSKALVFAILRKIVLQIPLLYLLNYLIPLYGLGFAELGAEIVLAIVASIMVFKLLKNLEMEQKQITNEQ